MRWLLILGSNHRRAAGLRLAARRLRQEFTLIAHAGPLPTRDARTRARYLNAAAIIESAAAPEQIRACLRQIEAEAGRERGNGLCALDIDLVARIEAGKIGEALKPADLEAAYARPLLAALGLG